MAQVVYKDIYYIIYGLGGLQGYILYNMAQVVYKDIYYIIYGSGGLQGFLLLSWF